MIEALIAIGVWVLLILIALDWRKAFANREPKVTDMAYYKENRLAKRAAYIAGKELGRAFHVGTRKRKLGRRR